MHLEISTDIYRREYIAIVAMEYSAVSPSTGLIVDIFLAEIIPLGVTFVFTHRNSSILLPENKHVSYVEAGREWKKEMVGMEGPKKKITLTFGRSVSPLPISSLLAFPTQMLSLCIRPNSISFR